MRSLSSAAAIAAALLVVTPVEPASAQGIGLGARIGSTGVGADLILGLTDKLAIKGGVGFIPLTYEGDFDGNDYTVEPPPVLATAALDVALFGPIRIMGGLLYRSEDILFDAEVSQGLEFNGETYSESGIVTGAVTSSSVAPFVGLGIGGVVGRGVGLYVDAGVAFTGDPGVEVSATGDVTQVPGFTEDLEAERASIEADIADYYRYWPILNIGLRIGFGN
jgi:hypothetical protein